MSKSTVLTSPSWPCKTVNNSKASSSTNSHSHTLLSREHVASSDADAFHAQPARDAVGVFAVTRRWRQGGLNSRRGRGARADHRRAARRRRNGPELWGGAEAPASRTRSEPRISRRHRGVINDGCEPLQGRCVKPLTSFSWPSSVAKISHASSWRDRRQTQHVASKDVAANNVPQGAQATRRTVLS